MSKGVRVWCAAGLACVCLTTAAEARTFKVNDHADHKPDACTRSDCTLREAVIAANRRAGKDVISLSRGGRYELELASSGEDAALDGDLDITAGPLTIRTRGEGRATIDANRTDRIFDIGAAATRIERLKLTGGHAYPADAGGDGGALVSGDFGDAAVTIVDSRIVDNRATGVDANGGAIDTDSTGLLRIVDTTLRGNVAGGDGGAITASIDGPVAIERSWIEANRAGEGGGVMAVGPVSITDSTISDNESVSGLDGELGDGAGIYVDDQGVVAITNTTLTGNRAIRNGGAIYEETGGTTRANAVTIAANVADSDRTGDGLGGGIYLSNSPLELLNSIVARNLAADAASDCAGDVFTGDAPNLIGTADGGCSPGAEIVADPQLEALGANGGPTPTMALAPTSPAVGTASAASAPTADQRGLNRDSAPDLGAFERQP